MKNRSNEIRSNEIHSNEIRIRREPSDHISMQLNFQSILETPKFQVPWIKKLTWMILDGGWLNFCQKNPQSLNGIPVLFFFRTKSEYWVFRQKNQTPKSILSVSILTFKELDRYHLISLFFLPTFIPSLSSSPFLEENDQNFNKS